MTLEEAIKLLGGTIEPTLEEARNGWTVNALTIYHAERAEAANDSILNPPKKKPIKTEGSFRWP